MHSRRQQCGSSTVSRERFFRYTRALYVSHTPLLAGEGLTLGIFNSARQCCQAWLLELYTQTDGIYWCTTATDTLTRDRGVRVHIRTKIQAMQPVIAGVDMPFGIDCALGTPYVCVRTYVRACVRSPRGSIQHRDQNLLTHMYGTCTRAREKRPDELCVISLRKLCWLNFF